MSGAYGPERVVRLERVTANGGYVVHLAREGRTEALCGAAGDMTTAFRAPTIYQPYSECEPCKRLAD